MLEYSHSYHRSVIVWCRATDKVRKSVITHWKLVKTHWKNKEGVKIRISISRYALGVQSSAYWLTKLKLRIDDVHLSVCRHIVNRFLCIIMSGITKTNVCNIIHVPHTIANYRYALQNNNTFSFTHCEKM